MTSASQALHKNVTICIVLVLAELNVAPLKTRHFSLTESRADSGQNQRMMAELQPLPTGPE